MALPEGVTTCTVTAGVPVSHTGAPVKAHLSIEPSVFLIHTATGTPLVDFLEEVSLNEGLAGQVVLPHTDQAGFQDENGNAYTNWYYTARISYSTPSKAKTKAPKIKVFQLAAGQALVDLDLLPGGAPALPYTAPIPTVTSVNGRTGTVTIGDADLPARLAEETLDAAYVGKGSHVLSAKDYVSVQQAIDAAAAATAFGGGTVLLPPGVYDLTAPLASRDNVRIIGYGATLRAAAGINYLLLGASTDFTLEGITFDGNGNVGGGIVTISQNATRWKIIHCRFRDLNYTAYAAIEAYRTVDTLVDVCRFDGCSQGVMSNGSTTRMTISNNHITNYKERGIYVLGTAADGVSQGLSITGNRIRGLVSHPGNHYPIHTVSTNPSARHSGLQVAGNTITGRGTSYTDPAAKGTADQISLHNVTQFTVSANISTDGGDMGITVESSDQGSVVGNICARNDAGGIAIWSSQGVSVSGNTCVNNGQNRQLDRTPDVGRCGVIVYDSSEIVTSANVLGDNQAPKTQVYGVSLQASASVKLGPDTNAGNATALYYNHAASSTGCTQVSLTAL